jgi:hypothetical protein
MLRAGMLGAAAVLILAGNVSAQPTPCTKPASAPAQFTAHLDKAIPARGQTAFTPAVLTLSWAMVEGAVAFHVEAGSQPGLDDVGVTLIQAPERSLTIPIANGTFYVRVRALNSCGSGTASKEARVRVTGSVAPGVPNPLVLLSTVHGTRERVGANAFVRVMGQVRNGWGAAAAAFVTVNVSYEGPSGGLGVSQSTFANGTGGRLMKTGAVTDTVLAPGATGCFVLFATFGDAKLTGLEVTAAAGDVVVEPLAEPLTIDSSSVAADAFDALVLSGRVTRAGDTGLPAEVWVEVRDAQGQVLDCRGSLAGASEFRVTTEAPHPLSRLLRWWSAPAATGGVLRQLLADPDAAPQEVAAAREAERREMAERERAAGR